MRADDKQLVPTEELDLFQERRENDLEHGRSRPHTAPEGRHDPGAQTARFNQVAEVVDHVFRERTLPAELEGFGDREQRALEHLQRAVAGKDTKSQQLVYAEDRRELLEQALAVLQPALAPGYGSLGAQAALRYAALAEQVGQLRDHIADLEDAQDDAADRIGQHVIEEDADETDDDEENDEEEEEEDEDDDEEAADDDASIDPPRSSSL